jgi:acetyltransferase-like isoleucine patch superfamily enzyme
MNEFAVSTDTHPEGDSITVVMPEGVYDTGKARLGSIICDGAKIGASSVINPGTVIDEGAIVHPLITVSGYVYPFSTVK